MLQEGEIERLGGRTMKVDLRLVAATNQDLRAAVREGRFREDLYYRLNVIAVPIPPLRDRRDDIPLLAEHFLQLYAARNNRQLAGFSRAAADALARYDWPGNVRELENTIERAVVLSRGQRHRARRSAARGAHAAAGAQGDGRSLSFAIGTPLEEIERRVIHATLRHVGRRQAPVRAAARHRHPDHLPPPRGRAHRARSGRRRRLSRGARRVRRARRRDAVQARCQIGSRTGPAASV